MDSKLKCVFEMPVDEETAVNEEAVPVDEFRKRLPESKAANKVCMDYLKKSKCI